MLVAEATSQLVPPAQLHAGQQHSQVQRHRCELLGEQLEVINGVALGS
jgi:hypothetical protein